MGVVYGSSGYGGAASHPPGKISYGWIGESWRIFGQAAGTWIVAVLIYAIAINVVSLVIRHLFPNPAYTAPFSPFGSRSYGSYTGYGTNSPFSPLGQVLNLLFGWLFGAFQSASLYRMAVKQVRGEAVSLADAFGGGPVYGAMIVFSLLFGLAAIVGVFVFCFGLFFVVGLLLPGYALVADGETAGNAISRSTEAMKRDWSAAALFTLVFTLVILVSAIPCALGLFVTLPMAHIISVLAYRDMIGMPNMNTPAEPDYGSAPPGVWPPPPAPMNTWPPPPGNVPPTNPPSGAPPPTG